MTRDEHRAAVIAAESMLQYTDIRPVVMEDAQDAHNVFLVVEGQSFNVTPFGCDTKQDAEWTQDMLCMALVKIVKNESCKP